MIVRDFRRQHSWRSTGLSRLSVAVISPSSAAAAFGMVASFFSVVSLSVFAGESPSEREWLVRNYAYCCRVEADSLRTSSSLDLGRESLRSAMICSSE